MNDSIQTFWWKASKLLSANDGRAYITHMGEAEYPNVTVRQLMVADKMTLYFNDDTRGRTYQLIRKSPRLIVNILNDTNPYQGYKIKGTAHFKERADEARVTIHVEDVFPY